MKIEFKKEDYFLCKSDDLSLGEYSLNYRIDRSHKGKDEDIGLPVVYLTDEQVEKCRKEGFIEIL